MATYGIYGSQPAATNTAPKKATDIFSGNTAPAVAQGAQPNQSTPATGAAVTNPFAVAPKPATTAFGPVAPAANPGSFEALLNNAGPARQQNATGSQQAISDMLMPSAGPSRESEASRSAFIKAQNESLRQGAEQSALSGRLQTGQIRGDNTALRNQALGQRRDLENDLAISDGKSNDANRQAGVSAFLQQEALGQQERTSQAQLAQGDRQLIESARQFDTRQEFETWATQEGYKQDEISRAWQSEETAKERTSREGVAFAGLSLEEKRLAQEGSQFASKLDFDKWALGKNLDNETAARLWQSIENEKKISSEEKVAFAGLSLEEKKLAQAGSQFDRREDFDRWALTKQLDDKSADRIWQSIEAEKARTSTATENALDRALNSSQFAERLGLDKQQLGETIRQFNSREDFDRWAKTTDIDEAERDRVWKAQQDDVTRKWTTGERLSGQEHEVLLEKMGEDARIREMERNQVLNLDTLEKQQAHDEKILGLQNTYQTFRDQQGFSHDEAMVGLEAQVQSMLSAQGYSQEQALQGARMEVERINSERDREMEERISMAQLVSSSNIAMQELGIKRDQLDLARTELTAELENNAAMLGMSKDQFALAKEDSRFQRALDTAAVLTEKWGDNPDTQAKAAEILFGGLKEVGMIDDAQYRIGTLNAKWTSFKDKATAQKWAAANGYTPEEIAEVSRAADTRTAEQAATTKDRITDMFNLSRIS